MPTVAAAYYYAVRHPMPCAKAREPHSRHRFLSLPPRYREAAEQADSCSSVAPPNSSIQRCADEGARPPPDRADARDVHLGRAGSRCSDVVGPGLVSAAGSDCAAALAGPEPSLHSDGVAHAQEFFAGVPEQRKHVRTTVRGSGAADPAAHFKCCHCAGGKKQL